VYPVLFELGPLKIHSFGAMVVLAFFFGGALVVRELKRREIEPNHLEGYPMVAMIGGIVGARIYYLAAHLDKLREDFFGSLFAGAGLTWYGGLIGGALAVVWWARRHQQRMWPLCDAFAPGLALAYGVGRIGCQLAGDGDYGPPSDLPWAMAYPNGVVPALEPCHPTPIYEVLMMGAITLILWSLRKRPTASGWLFGIYLMLVGAERWISEIFRIRPDRPMGMSVAQWLSIAVILAGIWVVSSRRSSART